MYVRMEVVWEFSSFCSVHYKSKNKQMKYIYKIHFDLASFPQLLEVLYCPTLSVAEAMNGWTKFRAWSPSTSATPSTLVLFSFCLPAMLVSLSSEGDMCNFLLVLPHPHPLPNQYLLVLQICSLLFPKGGLL